MASVKFTGESAPSNAPLGFASASIDALVGYLNAGAGRTSIAALVELLTNHYGVVYRKYSAWEEPIPTQGTTAPFVYMRAGSSAVEWEQTQTLVEDHELQLRVFAVHTSPDEAYQKAVDVAQIITSLVAQTKFSNNATEWASFYVNAGYQPDVAMTAPQGITTESGSVYAVDVQIRYRHQDTMPDAS